PASSGFPQEKQSYDYTYDKLNRLELAAYTTPGKTGYFNEKLSYDKAGNIQSLERTSNGTGKTDQLSYTYEESGQSNRLASLTDGSSSNEGQPAGTTNYTYDDNGNLASDSKKQLTINYNELNLPKAVTQTGSNQTITYLYDASGRKLRKEATGGNRDYIGGIEYGNDGHIEFIQTEEGRAVKSGESYSYEYMLRDHLSNTRAVVKQDGSIIQLSDYYAFGMEMNHNGMTPSPDNRYKYNGKELQTELGMNQYDYGARFYDPAIGRFGVIDPKAEEATKYSPFVYAINNPMRFIDINGEGPGDRVKAARQMIGSLYKWENSTLRTGMTSMALEFKDCSELVNRVLFADGITDRVLTQNTAAMKTFFGENGKFIHSDKPEVGDIALWNGHVGIVSGVDKSGKIKLIHARGKSKKASENAYYLSPKAYRDSEFYGYYRPVKETPDGKLDGGKKNEGGTNNSNANPKTTQGEEQVNEFVPSDSIIRYLIDSQKFIERLKDDQKKYDEIIRKNPFSR
ncbi:RHS repeat-associated core domain-containing protein, partial [Pararcticibacter amylolyticus]